MDTLELQGDEDFVDVKVCRLPFLREAFQKRKSVVFLFESGDVENGKLAGQKARDFS